MMAEATKASRNTNTNRSRSLSCWHKRLLYELFSPSYPMYCLLEFDEQPFKHNNKQRLQQQQQKQQKQQVLPSSPQPQQQDQKKLPPRIIVNIYQCICGPYRPIITTIGIFQKNIPNFLKHTFNNYVFYIRTMFLVLSLHVFYIDLNKYPPHNLRVYMYFLTHWGQCINIIYLFCSLLCCCCCCIYNISYDNHNNDVVAVVDTSGKELPKLIKLTWSLYATAAPLSIAITLLYWIGIVPVTILTTNTNNSNSFNSSSIINYVSIMEHGGIGLLVLLDGILVGTIPLRAKQYVFMLGVCLAYLIWSIINFIFNLGNGDWGPQYGDDDNLYPVLDWDLESRRGTAMISGFAILILCPIVYWSVWMLSLVSIRRRKDEDNKEVVVVEEEAEKAVSNDALLLVTRTKTTKTKTKTTTTDGLEGSEGNDKVVKDKQHCCDGSFCRRYCCCCCFCCYSSCCCCCSNNNNKQTSSCLLLWEGRRRPLLLLLDDVAAANDNNNNNNNNTTYYYYEADDDNGHHGTMYNEMSDYGGGGGGILA